MKTIYVFLGKKCKETHALSVDFDMMNYYKSEGKFPFRIKEVELKPAQKTKILVFDEYSKLTKKDIEKIKKISLPQKKKGSK